MESHRDRMHQQQMVDKWLKSLEEKAQRVKDAKGSEITGGKPGEIAKEEYMHANGVTVRHLPDDEHGVLRISIGGGEHLPVNVTYCVIRGDKDACIALLERALVALRG